MLPRLSSLRRQEPSQAFETKTVFFHLYKVLIFLNVSLGPCLRRDDRVVGNKLLLAKNDGFGILMLHALSNTESCFFLGCQIVFFIQN
jgi:hypothetical protein